MVVNCQSHIVESGKIWDQPLPQLCARLDLVLQLHAAVYSCFRQAWSRLLEFAHVIETAKEFALCRRSLTGYPAANSTNNGNANAGDAHPFACLDFFANRCKKLHKLFDTIHQFSSLGQVCHVHLP